jgi:holliday junction DNA helicase RuvA
MIASLNGVVLGARDNSIIIGIGGLGIEVFVPLPAYNEMLGEVGDPVFLHTYLVVREDALTLYGFREDQERAIFTQLLTVSGVGPRLALSVLSTLRPETLASAIQRDEPELISRVPGIGKKTAQKIVLDLKGKIMAQQLPPGMAVVSSHDTEIIDALTALGYSIVEAQAAIQGIPRDASDDIEERIRLALGYFSQQ